MTTRLAHALEVTETSATLYLCGTLAAADAFALRALCREIPARVRTLRLDIHAVARIDDDAMSTVRAVVRYWKHSRGGCFRMSIASEHLVANLTCDDEQTSPQLFEPHLPTRAALMGMFL